MEITEVPVIVNELVTTRWQCNLPCVLKHKMISNLNMLFLSFLAMYIAMKF